MGPGDLFESGNRKRAGLGGQFASDAVFQTSLLSNGRT